MTRLRPEGRGAGLRLASAGGGLRDHRPRDRSCAKGAPSLASRATASLTQAELIRLHGRAGTRRRSMPSARQPAARDAAPVALRSRACDAPPLVRDVSFAVRRGEILGLGGLVGAGRSETVEAIFGLRAAPGGHASRSAGKPLAPRSPPSGPRRHRLRRRGSARARTSCRTCRCSENLLLAHLGAHRGFGLGYRSARRKVDAAAREPRPAGRPAARCSMLELLRRHAAEDHHCALAAARTQGADPGRADQGRRHRHARSRSTPCCATIAAKGVAVVVVSSDFEELLGLSRPHRRDQRRRTASPTCRAAMLDEEKLTLLAAPRTSMARNTETAAASSPATRTAPASGPCSTTSALICLNAVVANDQADPGFVAGEARALRRDRAYRPALAGPRDRFVPRDRTARVRRCSCRYAVAAATTSAGSGSPSTPRRAHRRRCHPQRIEAMRHRLSWRRPIDQHLAATSSDRNSRAIRGLARSTRRLEVRMLGLALVIALALSVLSPYFLTRINSSTSSTSRW